MINSKIASLEARLKKLEKKAFFTDLFRSPFGILKDILIKDLHLKPIPGSERTIDEEKEHHEIYFQFSEDIDFKYALTKQHTFILYVESFEKVEGSEEYVSFIFYLSPFTYSETKQKLHQKWFEKNNGRLGLADSCTVRPSDNRDKIEHSIETPLKNIFERETRTYFGDMLKFVVAGILTEQIPVRPEVFQKFPFDSPFKLKE